MSKKQALILDDDKIRHQQFVDKYLDQYDIHHAYNMMQFCRILVGFPFTLDYVSLDHDLGDADAGSGMDAARLLCAVKAGYRPTKVNVHSQNPIGSENMTALLFSGGFDPTEIKL